MNIDNLNPENNNQNNFNPINPGETNVAPMEPNFGTPPINPEPVPGPIGTPPINPEPIPGPIGIPPVNPEPVPGPTGIPPVNPEPIPGPTETPPVNPMGTINLNPEGVASSEAFVEQPSPLMGSTLTANTPLTNDPINQNNNMNNTPINNPNNMINEIPNNPTTFGGVPTPSEAPIANEFIPKPSKKKGGKKAIIIILIFVLILGIGAAVYYFLNVSNPKTSVSVTAYLGEWELGTELSQNITDYANITGIDPTSCTLNTDAVNVNVANSYTYSITCPGLKEPVTGSLKVTDNKGPEVKLKKLTVKPGTEVLPEDFIESCTDPSVSKECDISIKDDSIDLEEIVSEVGEYTIPLSVKDDFDHETEVDATLIVDENAPTTFLSCELNTDYVTTTNGDITITYEYGANDNGELVSISKVATYKFKKQSDYDAAKTEYDNNKMLDDIKGTATFDDKAKIITLVSDIDISDLQTELDSDTELKTYEDVAIFHEDVGDICSLP